MGKQAKPTIKERLDSIIFEEGIDELYVIFYEICKENLPLVIFEMEVGTYIVRQRINEKYKDFKNAHQLSYPPCDLVHYGRANIPGHPMFYGSAYGASDTVLPRIVTLLETSEFAQDPETCGIERATFGRWDVIDKLQLIALPFSTSYEKPIPEIMQIQNDWNTQIINANIYKDAMSLVEYMSDEIAKKTNSDMEYFKIANFVYFLLYINENTKGYDGIIYPSVAARGEGYNIALKPETVDAKLQFSTALLCYLVKNKGKECLDNVKHSISKSPDGSLVYEYEPDFSVEKYKDYTFVN